MAVTDFFHVLIQKTEISDIIYHLIGYLFLGLRQRVKPSPARPSPKRVIVEGSGMGVGVGVCVGS